MTRSSSDQSTMMAMKQVHRCWKIYFQDSIFMLFGIWFFFTKWVWVSTFVCKYIYRFSMDMHRLNFFLKTRKYDPVRFWFKPLAGCSFYCSPYCKNSNCGFNPAEAKFFVGVWWFALDIFRFAIHITQMGTEEQWMSSECPIAAARGEHVTFWLFRVLQQRLRHVEYSIYILMREL